jgi:multidrug efflux pump subunit AcrB
MKSSFNLTEWALNHRATVLFLILAIMIGGVLGFKKLGQLEDPNFSVPSMTVMVIWPAPPRSRCRTSAQPDGEEVRAARPLRQGQDVRAPGLRRHAALGQGRHLARRPARGLVPGAQEVQRLEARAARRRHRPIFNDEFGDVTGLLYAVKGDGISQWELSDISEDIKRRLLKVPMVKKVDIYGKQEKKVYVEFSNERLAALGITPLQIARACATRTRSRRAGRSTPAATG